jgi:hypothetical protein
MFLISLSPFAYPENGLGRSSVLIDNAPFVHSTFFSPYPPVRPQGQLLSIIIPFGVAMPSRSAPVRNQTTAFYRFFTGYLNPSTDRTLLWKGSNVLAG